MSKYVYLIILFVLILGGAVAGLFYVLRQEGTRGAAEVVLGLSVPEAITSGDEVSFLVSYKNGTGIPLQEAELFFRYPENSIPLENPDQLIKNVSLGTLQPNKEYSYTFTARVIGTKNSVMRSSAELTYKSAGGVVFRKKTDAVIRIADAAFFLNLVVPQRAVAGEHIVYFLTYENLAPHAFAETRIRMHYPDGFLFSSAEPAPTYEEDVWDIGEVAVLGKGRIAVSGTLDGEEGDAKKVKAEIGFVRDGKFSPYQESFFDTIISPPPLSVTIELQDHPDHIAHLGEMLTMKIGYQNNAEVPLKDVVLRAELASSLFSFKGLSAERGFFDSTRNIVIWNPQNVKELLFLNPGEKYFLTLRVALKDAFPISSAEDTNFTARVIVTIESINVPPYLALNKISSSSLLEIKIETRAELEAVAYYKDDSSGIVNFGPLPPKANTETRYTIHWRVSVPANDLENVEVRSTLPSGVMGTGEAVSRYTDAKPSFNEATGEVIWFIPRVPANTGITQPAFETVFQVSVIPSTTQVGKSVELIRASLLSAVDSFTGRQLTADIQAIRTDQLSDDIANDRAFGIVIP
ncbi:MAG: hypothetical protein Q7S09_02010 [bacterium]|nr:hypothetical protein [bacterium]